MTDAAKPTNIVSIDAAKSKFMTKSPDEIVAFINDTLAHIDKTFIQGYEAVSEAIMYLLNNNMEQHLPKIKMTPNQFDMFKLIGEGNLSSKLIPIVISNTDIAKIAATLPKSEQDRACDNGVEVLRKGKIQNVPLRNVKAKELQRIIRVEDGINVLMSGEDQRKTITYRPNNPTMKLVTIEFTLQEYTDLLHRAAQQETTIDMFIREQSFRE